jgi:hypothetical protein
MKPHFDIHLKINQHRYWFDCGWYYGEEFKLLKLSILEILTGANEKVDQINFLNVQVTKFIISCGVSLW